MSIIRNLEVVYISEVEKCVSSMVKSIGSTKFVHCIEVGRSSEGLLLEVSLYNVPIVVSYDCVNA